MKRRAPRAASRSPIWWRLSGETASFLAGGEFPVPEVGATGTPSFDYKQYGVGLSFTPTVLSDGLINLMIKPEVSEIDTPTP